MFNKIKRKIKSVDFYKRATVSFCTSIVFLALASIQIILLLFRDDSHFGDYILLVVVDIIVSVVFLIIGLTDKKRNSSK